MIERTSRSERRLTVTIDVVRVPTGMAVAPDVLMQMVESDLTELFVTEPLPRELMRRAFLTLAAGKIEVAAGADVATISRSIAKHLHAELCAGRAA